MYKISKSAVFFGKNSSVKKSFSQTKKMMGVQTVSGCYQSIMIGTDTTMWTPPNGATDTTVVSATEFCTTPIKSITLTVQRTFHKDKTEMVTVISKIDVTQPKSNSPNAPSRTCTIGTLIGDDTYWNFPQHYEFADGAKLKSLTMHTSSYKREGILWVSGISWTTTSDPSREFFVGQCKDEQNPPQPLPGSEIDCSRGLFCGLIGSLGGDGRLNSLAFLFK